MIPTPRCAPDIINERRVWMSRIQIGVSTLHFTLFLCARALWFLSHVLKVTLRTAVWEEAIHLMRYTCLFLFNS